MPVANSTSARRSGKHKGGHVIRYITGFVLSLFAFGTRAQTPPKHQHAAANVIDGAAHPELIPDSVAYRLYFVAVSTVQNPAEAEQKHQHAHLMKTGLGD